MPAERVLPSSAAAAGLALSATVKYNPHLWGPDELRSIFVVRTRELADLLERLRATPEGQVPQHLLITGSRGMGKTTLLRRLAVWLGASYQALESEHAYQDAFWDFFDRLELRPLQAAEMRSAMLALARTFGAGRGPTGEAAEREMARILDSRPERLKALRAITGGNPRTTVMLYELFAAGGSDDVHSDLRRLLDTMTPLYKARMETLSDQARK